MDFADYRYIEDGYGGGTVLVPFEAVDVAFGAFGVAPSRLEVLDHDAREVDFVGGEICLQTPNHMNLQKRHYLKNYF